MNGTVVRNIDRADAAALAALEKLGVATLHEAQGRSGLMRPDVRPVWSGARICGSAVTALIHPGDNWMIHVAVEVVKPGDVLVVACSSDNLDGAFGEMRFPVWSRAISARGTVKASLGTVNLPVECAGVHVRPGDAVVADDDGVVVVPRADAARVAQAGAAREAKEAASRAKLEAGELGLDLYGMRAALAEKGLKYVDGPLE
jgi:4-hydroxy-4-methyl-2-oxoglutarate aldolase